jgi:protein phosphatase 1L
MLMLMLMLIFFVWFIPIQVMANQEAVDIAKKTKDPHKAAKQLAAEALKRESKDDISCIVVRFKQ